jgi:phosphoadenylyl-sulfate reductase (thioredoxin)
MAFDHLELSPPLRGRGQGEGDVGASIARMAALCEAEAGVALTPPRLALAPKRGEGSIDSLRHASPERILRAALGAFGDRIALVSSFGAESAVLLHMAAEIDRDIPVLFLDTGMQFGQTLDYRKQLAARLGLTNVNDLRPAFKDLAAADPSSTLWKTDTDACCHLRKVVPLQTALEGFDAWITGRKRFQAASRANLPVVEAAGRLVKVNPTSTPTWLRTTCRRIPWWRRASPPSVAGHAPSRSRPATMIAKGAGRVPKRPNAAYIRPPPRN